MKRKNILECLWMPLPELEEYYRQRREWKYTLHIPLKHINLRKYMHPLYIGVIALDRIRKHQKITVISDKRKAAKSSIIFAVTHIGYDDIAIVCEAIKTPAYIFLGDPKTLYRHPVGLLLYLNGVIFVDLSFKDDRKVSMARSLELLQRGGNLLIFPEGAWNIKENVPVMKLFPGAVKMAAETGAEIVPVAVEQYGQSFLVNIGENIVFNRDVDITKETVNLRDIMCTLKWEIFEHTGIQKRTELSKDYWKQHLKDIWGIQNAKEVTMEEIERGIFRDKATSRFNGEC